MNRIKILVLLLFSLGLILGPPANALLNPASPGLPSATYGSSTYPNNTFSSMCVDCHGRNPYSGSTVNGSHFVSAGPGTTGTAQTNSGGGWGTAGVDSQSGPRDDGAYFKINPWGVGAASKYGRLSDNSSISTTATGNHTGTVLDNSNTGIYQGAEIICESCHNILVNGLGGNNILMASVAQTAAAAEDPAASVIPNLCVGCHGDMYSVSATNASVNNTKYNSTRNRNDTNTANRKGVNTVHRIGGVLFDMNHHVTTGDVVDGTLVGAGLAWRDTLTIDPNALLNPVSNSGTRGQMSQLGSWADGKSKPPTAVNCLNCHAVGHGGSQYTAASILRDTSALRTSAPSTTGLLRLSDTGRQWFDINDTLYCNDCHTVAPAR